MAKHMIEKVGEYAKLFRYDNGIAVVEDGSTGLCFSVHPNISVTGSVRGMKLNGYWDKDDKTVRAGSYIFNISRVVVDKEEPYEVIASQNCECETCTNLRLSAKSS